MKQLQQINIDLRDRQYSIVIGHAFMDQAVNYIVNVMQNKRLFIVTDKNVAALYLEDLQTALLKHSIEVECFIVQAGEQAKQFSVFESLLDDMLSKRMERQTTLLALGGGVVGDLTGFAASVLLRGVPFIQMPTTLLAQVDSSVGGKTGINSPHGKNLIGCFYQPSLVLMDSFFLQSLPKRDYLSGYAEIVKYGLLQDVQFFEWLDKRQKAILERDKSVLNQAIYQSCQVKADIVSRDEKEKDIRALLNLGHTFAHVLERETGYSDLLHHGEAVSIGMVLAFKFSAYLGYCNTHEALKVSEHLNQVGLPTSLSDIDINLNVTRFIDQMMLDKKVSDGQLVFILAHKIGHAFIAKNITIDSLSSFLQSQINSEH